MAGYNRAGLEEFHGKEAGNMRGAVEWERKSSMALKVINGPYLKLKAQDAESCARRIDSMG